MTRWAYDLTERNHAFDELDGQRHHAYLTGAGLIAAVENQATMQRLLAAELREEAAILAHTNAIRKRQSDMVSQFRQDATTLFK